MNAHTACVTGILTNLSNPKAVIFFASVFAHFIDPDLSLSWALAMALFLIITGIIWFVGVALFVRTIATTLLRNTALIDIIAGSILLILSSMMLIEGSYAAFRTISLH
ncbi:hypothetical protein GCM10009621_25170 [Corynebacterium felinum]|uniref:Threonine/homoserine/homoserine lactone efflux protein n=2 Tax=Corynebacterium TaxID=1716 RepID=A0ABU2B6V9_9CORY|nr:threonine/homoserine/homoserine lactone efflux protein [Corynebacterium felinum]